MLDKTFSLEGNMKNNINGTDTNVGSIDEDIKILKEFTKVEFIMTDKKEITKAAHKEISQAISNVLSELETYKKIADKIKERKKWLEDNILDNDYASDNDKDKAEYQVDILQEIIDWARNEVENNI